MYIPCQISIKSLRTKKEIDLKIHCFAQHLKQIDKHITNIVFIDGTSSKQLTVYRTNVGGACRVDLHSCALANETAPMQLVFFEPLTAGKITERTIHCSSAQRGRPQLFENTSQQEQPTTNMKQSINLRPCVSAMISKLSSVQSNEKCFLLLMRNRMTCEGNA